MGIPIRPFKTGKQLNIVDASGNSLHLLGSAQLFIQIPQVLGEKVERVEAAVLADNDVDSELLISLSLLIAWDLVPPKFPRQTVSAYFKELLTKNKDIQKCAKVFSTGTQKEQDCYKLPKPSSACVKLKERILKKFKGVFKEKLDKDDRISCSPVRLKINPD